MGGFLEKVATQITAWRVIKIFLGKTEEPEVRKEAGKVALANILYRFYDYMLIALAIGIVSAMKSLSFDEKIIFVVLWALTLVGTAPVVMNILKVDMTVREGLRRWLEALYTTSSRPILPLLIICEIGICIWEIAWNGPECFFIFFRSRISRWPLWAKVVLYILATGAQMALWTKIYCLGYDSISDLIAHYWN